MVKVTDPLGNVTSYAYDAKGNRTGSTDANGNVTTFEYDDQGHLVKTIDAMGFVTIFEYGGAGCTSCGGGAGKLRSLTDAVGNTTAWQYDLLGRLTRETDPLAKATAYNYDAVGNLLTRTDARGIVTAFSYDPLRRLTGKSYTGGGGESYTYDAIGRILTAGNGSVTYTYTYDAVGRVTTVADSRGYILLYSYDLLGKRTRTTLKAGTADQRVTTYAYDNSDRLTGITSEAGTFTFGYDVAGRRTTLSYPNQVVAAYAFDNAGRLTSLTHKAGDNTVASFDYTLDKVGNRLTKSGAVNESYQYDTLYRLTQTTAADGTEKYAYDQVGNRLTGPGPKDTLYQYAAGNRMTRGRAFGYAYDDNGNQSARTVPNAPDKGWTLTWDHENRLVKMEKTKGATEKQTVTFSYDPMGRRIGKSVEAVKDGVTNTSTYAYVYDNDNIAMEIMTTAGGTEKIFYTHGPGVDEHLALERGGNFYYYHADGLGSVVALTDSAHQTVQGYEYDSFGVAKANGNVRNSYTYTGREWDRETGLYYYRARYYDPVEGRFVSKDPIGFEGGDVNLYAYVQNNPVNDKDPFGLSGLFPEPSLPSFLYLTTFNAHREQSLARAVSNGQLTRNFTMPMIGLGLTPYAIGGIGSASLIAGPQLSAAGSCALAQGSSLYASGMTIAGSPLGQSILNNAPDFISPFFPGPPAPNIAGGAGWLTSILFSYMGLEVK